MPASASARRYASAAFSVATETGDYDAWLKAQKPDSSLAEKWNGIWDKYHPEFNKII